MFDHELVRLAGTLWLGQQSLEQKWHAHRARAGRGRDRRLEGDQALEYLTEAFRDIAGVVDAIGRGARDGRELAVEDLAHRLTDDSERLLDLGADIRRHRVEPECAQALELTARLTDRPLHQIHRFVDEAVAALGHDESPDALSERSAAFEPLVRVELDPDLEAELRDELVRLSARLA